jgi:cysteinyl-tRNA synthetase
MSMKYLGESFDIHTGGEDNIFPHHECEIAQSEGANGKPFVSHWLHTRFLLVEGKKMSKSLGNFYTVPDLVARGYSGREIRYLLLSTHYRTQQNFTIAGLDAARKSLERIDAFVDRLDGDPGSLVGDEEREDTTSRADLAFLHECAQRFDDALASDLNISGALGAIFDLIREGNRRTLTTLEAGCVLSWLREADEVLGVIYFRSERGTSRMAATPAASAVPVGVVGSTGSEAPAASGAALPDAEIDDMLARRQAARSSKNFAEADLIRKKFASHGYVIEDTPKGARVKRM